MRLLQKNGNSSEVCHATLNPAGPGAVRIFLIPPKRHLFSRAPSVLILDGHFILPIGYSWAILLGCFLNEINQYKGNPIEQTEFDAIITAAVESCRHRYRYTAASVLEGDLRQILKVLIDVAQGRTPDIDIGQLSLRQYAPHMTAPHRMDLLVSAMEKDGHWNCNQQCLHCYAAGQPASEADELTTQQWKKMIDAYRAAGIPQLTFTGGEPTMRDDLPELVAHARWFITRLNTNGVRLTPELCTSLRQAELDSVQITLYSADEAVHNRLVGAENFEKTVRGLQNALSAGLDVSVNTPLCTDNSDYGENLAFLHTLGVQYVSCSGLILTGNATTEPSKETRLSPDALYEILKKATDFCAKNDMEISFTSPGWLSAERLQALRLDVPVCGACLSNMATAPDGKVVPCQSWLSDNVSLGNALSDPWKHIWNHPACKRIRAMGEEESLLCLLREEKR